MTVPRSEAEAQLHADATPTPSLDVSSSADVGHEPVADPFPNRGMLGKPRGDPLDPEEYVVTIEAGADGDGRSYRLDVDGGVRSHPDGASVERDGERVSGELASDESVEVVVRGLVTWIEADDALEVTVRERN